VFSIINFEFAFKTPSLSSVILKEFTFLKTGFETKTSNNPNTHTTVIKATNILV
jgi:hypothetical protein